MTLAEVSEVYPVEPRRHRWTRDEYHGLEDGGFLKGRRVELIDGQILDLPPMKTPHAAAVGLADIELRRVFGQGYQVRVQLPLALTEHDEPHPDFAVVRGGPRDFLIDHPASALLVIEVSESSLREDRQFKASLYASVGIQDYWIVNLVDRCLEVYRNARSDASKWFGFSYGAPRVLRSGEEIAPLAAPDKPIKVADLLP